MSFGGGSGFSFGSTNNNQQQGAGFGGFGNSANSTGTGFGATSNTGFGSTSTSTNPFGGGTGFGSNTGGAFGSTNTGTNSLFGANANKPSGFGAGTTGGSLFGSTSSTTPGTGFGGGGLGTSNSGAFGTNNNTSAFGSNTSSAAPFSFGASKPAFGASNTGGTLFGQGGAGTTSGFGSTSAFGSGGVGTALNQAVPTSEGTAGTPFNPTVEQDGTSTNKNSYQSINFQQPYQKYSFEELRLADYNAGRRFGNGSGQAGAFGASTFGGFGNSNSNTTGFGNNSNPFGGTSNSSALGANTSTSGGFGGGLFGNSNANKPAGSLFGQQTSASSGGGLFGTTNNASSGFGGSANTGFGGSNTGGGLFGNSQNQAQKPSLFGNTGSTGNTGGAFSFGGNASTSNNATGLFGNANSNTNAFGNNNTNNNQQSTNPFGASQTANQPKPLFGGTGTGFGTSTTQGQSSGGLFGNTSSSNTAGGLFGNTSNSQPQSNSLFGNTNTANTSGGLFGNANANNNQQQQKPSLFGNSFGATNNTNTGSSLFPGSTNTNQGGGNSLFGNSQTSTGGGFSFGQSNNNQKPASGGLFGSTNNSNQSGGLFGTTNNSGSMFGQPQNNLQNSMQQQDGPRHASQLESSPFTQSSIWTGLPQATPQNSAPLLTPLSASTRLNESASKPAAVRLQSSRYNTPPARPKGFGFTYSTYGTPNSAASTPGGGGLGTGMYNSRGFTGGSFGRSLHKSFSSSMLRPSYEAAPESILSPGAFTPGSSRYSSGSIRRLTIDRSIRSDLFSRPTYPALPPPAASVTSGPKDTVTPSEESTSEQPHKLKKRVSFDKDVSGGSQKETPNVESGALVRTEVDDEEHSGETPRARRGKAVNGTMETEQSRGRELAAVPEDRESENAMSIMKIPGDVTAKADPEPGAYFMKPSRSEISKMPRDKLQRFTNFVVGRKGCGFVTFNGAVDLTSVPLDDVFDKIVEIRLRSITVYPEASTKPPAGKGLNVPSTLYIENSWPRARNMPSSATSGPIYDKHINRLKKMSGTIFLNYENATGVWTFKVPHYTRYGLDYDEDGDLNDDDELSSPPDTVEEQTPPQSAEASAMDLDGGASEDSMSAEDDTFAFKQKTIPGGFGRLSMIDDEHEREVPDSGSEHSVTSEEEASDTELSMAGTFPQPQAVSFNSLSRPILKSRLGTPGKPLLDLDGDWADQLQRTISPRKQNRDALRELQSKVLLDRIYEPIRPQRVTSRPEFRNSLDIMNSLFGKHEERMAAARRKETAGPDFEFPYSKRPKLFDQDAKDMSKVDQAFHASFKPKWTGTGTLLYCRSSDFPADKGISVWKDTLLMEDRAADLIVSSLSRNSREALADTGSLGSCVDIILCEGVPFSQQKSLPFSFYAECIHAKQSKPVSVQVREALDAQIENYELAHLLFDDYEDEFTTGLTSQQKIEFDFRIRKDRLTTFLTTLIVNRHQQEVLSVDKSMPDEAAIFHLTTKNVKAACRSLKAQKNYNLMMLVAQIEQADESFQSDIAAQIAAWREQNIISEMSEPVRALYEILSGNTTVSEGKSNGPVEDRASRFSISDRFRLEWMQAFGLCLWYGKAKNGSIQDAVQDFAAKVETGAEHSYPSDDAEGRESPLWVLLKLYASLKGAKKVKTPVLPQALSALSQSFDCRITFQMHHALTSRLTKARIDADKADDMAADMAFQHAAKGDLLGAVFALLHISDAGKRESIVRDLLMRFAESLPDKPSDSRSDEKTKMRWDALTVGLKIPQAWIFEAKALYARSRNESLDELNYLIAAEQWLNAHECFCRRVAPRAVIDEDWALLQEVLGEFGENVEGRVGDWSQGGSIYADFVALVGSAKISMKDARAKLKSLQGSLAEMGRRFRSRGNNLMAGGVEELEERVACREMSARVAEMLIGEGLGQTSSILDLPLTADARLQQTRNMSVEYYRASLVAAR